MRCQRHELHRQDDGRHIVEGLDRRHPHHVVAVLPARMHLVPALVDQVCGRLDASAKPRKVTVEDAKSRGKRDQAQVARALEYRLGLRELRREIDGRAVERLAVLAGEVRGRQHSLGARDKIEVIGVPFEVEIGAARIVGGYRTAQRRQIHPSHSIPLLGRRERLDRTMPRLSNRR
jgi:hypothetical protein